MRRREQGLKLDITLAEIYKAMNLIGFMGRISTPYAPGSPSRFSGRPLTRQGDPGGLRTTGATYVDTGTRRIPGAPLLLADIGLDLLPIDRSRLNGDNLSEVPR